MTDLLAAGAVFQQHRGATPNYYAGCFDEQRAFVTDPAKRRAMLVGRRGGKTDVYTRWLLQSLEERPGSTSIYIARTQKSARRIIWPAVRAVIKQLGAPVTPNEQSLEWRKADGSRLWITGCETHGAADDVRGVQKVGRVGIDECGSFPSDLLQYLVVDCVDPGLMDLDGEMALSGTPGLNPLGFFYDRTAGERPWSTHQWTAVQNPHVRGQAYLDAKRAEYNWAEDHPTYVREYLGRWVRDESARIYPYDAGLNAGIGVPRDGGLWSGRMPDSAAFVLSVDLGYHDATAFVVAAYIPGQPEVHIVRAWKETEASVARVAGLINQARHQLREEYGKGFAEIVVDRAGPGRQIAAEFSETYGRPGKGARKPQKQDRIHMLRGAMLAGTLRVDVAECLPLISEWAVLPWNEKRDDHHESYLDDCADAALYAHAECTTHYIPREEPPLPGSPEVREAERAEAKREALSVALDKQLKRSGLRRGPWGVIK